MEHGKSRIEASPGSGFTYILIYITYMSYLDTCIHIYTYACIYTHMNIVVCLWNYGIIMEY